MGAGETLESYLGGKWLRGEGVETELVDPTNGAVLGTASARGIDLKSALEYARGRGGSALRALNYAERAKLLSSIADVLSANRTHYEEIAIANSGNTKLDAAIDIDGGIGTLKYYARLGTPLGTAKALLDEKPVRLAKAENFQAIHLMVLRHGVAIHINAFNFPSWGLWEKAACALLSGMPVLAKPASATCWLSHQMVRDVVAAKVLPDGAINLLCGGAGSLLDHVTAEDVIAFTGSSDTASRIVSHRNVLARGARVNVEADSVNAALLAPGCAPATPAFDAFIKEVAREITVKAGQKCTAIRRVFVPAARANSVAEALTARLTKTTVGDPRNEATRMGPLVSRIQQKVALEGIQRLAREAKFVTGSPDAPKLDGIDGAKSAFVAPTLLRAEGGTAQTIHDTEIFGPAATVIPYEDEADAFTLIARGGGSLVASVYGEDRDFLARAITELGASHGRILAVEPSVADSHTGHGIVMPQCHHGGPGRAGNGAELGGLHGLSFYHQRVAVQGSSELLAALQGQAAPAH
ncbi:MAG TPA: 3,4-dehydroadipyl-CoA semialdehyde dehydrogenase [Pseudolabrys sp.]|nr:3,4-dehydroadipyl-CoA semialdehyde dehydrogenase [Pseudolabrys sp.]